MIVSMQTAVFPGFRDTDDQLALAAANGIVFNRWPSSPFAAVAFNGSRSITLGARDFDRAKVLGIDRALAVDGLADGVDHAAEQFVAHGYGSRRPVRLTRSPSEMWV